MQHKREILCKYRLERAKEESSIQLEHAETFVKTIEAYILRKEEKS